MRKNWVEKVNVHLIIKVNIFDQLSFDQNIILKQNINIVNINFKGYLG